jgi:hypothetical protein
MIDEARADGVDNGDSVDRHGARSLVAAVVILMLLTTAELLVPGQEDSRALRITALAGLLFLKVGIVSVFFLRVRANRRATGLLAVALIMAAGFAVILMIESWYRGGLR